MKYIDKILFAVACAYLGATLFWLTNNDKVSFSEANQSKTQPIAQSSQPSSADVRFAAYLERSLELMDRKAKSDGEPTAATPQPAVASNPVAVPQNTPTIVERIYVPVYPENQTPTVAVAPSNPTASTLVPPPPSSPSASPTPNAPKTEKTGLTLVGLLESGDRAYALIDFNGTTRRFERGEPIGTSGWTLIGVRDRQAIVHSNGATRSLEVGQGF